MRLGSAHPERASYDPFLARPFALFVFPTPVLLLDPVVSGFGRQLLPGDPALGEGRRRPLYGGESAFCVKVSTSMNVGSFQGLTLLWDRGVAHGTVARSIRLKLPLLDSLMRRPVHPELALLALLGRAGDRRADVSSSPRQETTPRRLRVPLMAVAYVFRPIPNSCLVFFLTPLGFLG